MGAPLFVLSLTLALARAPFASAAPVVIDFDDLADLDAVGNHYPGVDFSDAVTFSAGISLNEFDFPPVSGLNVAVDDGGPIAIAFASPVLTVGAFFTYSAPVALRAYDASNVLVASVFSAFAENYVSSGNPANEWLQIAWALGIARVEILGAPDGFSFAMDDLAYEPALVPVPEPGTVLLMIAGFAVSRARGRRPAQGASLTRAGGLSLRGGQEQ